MIGTSLAQYQIVSELGRGGMGIVYRATDMKLDRTVALKVLPAAALSSAHDRARFYREARAAAALNHPNIAAIYQIDEAVALDANRREIHASDGPRPFIAMEFIEGETLQDRIRKGPLKIEEAVRIATGVAEALRAAHAKNIVHRDIKSANIMLTGDETPKVLDFGLAQTSASTKLTQMGSTVGTVAYMSPEQARGDDVDGRSDLYSLGTVLYEMIAGRLPFTGDYEQAIVYSILNEEPEPLTAVRTGVPMGLESIVAKLLAKAARHRYQTPADLLADLETVDLSGSGQQRRSEQAVGAQLTATGAGKLSAVPMWGWGLVGIAVATALGLGLLLGSEDASPRIPTVLSINLPGTVNPMVASWAPDGRAIYYVAQDSAGMQKHIRVFDLDRGTFRILSGTDDASYVHISPNGRWLVLQNGKTGQYERMLVDGGRPSAIPRAKSIWPHNDASMSTTGDLFFVTSSFGIASVAEDGTYRVIVDGDTTASRFDRPIPSASGDGVFWSEAIFPNDVGGTWYQSLDAGLPHVVLPDFALWAIASNNYALLMPTGSRSEPTVIAPFDRKRGQLLSAPVPFAPMASFDLSASGDLVYQVGQAAGDEVEPLFRIDSAGPVPLEAGSFSGNFSTAWNRNAIIWEQSYFSGESQGRWDLYLHDLDARTTVRLTRDGVNRNPTWSPDDKYVYFTRQDAEGGPRVVRKAVDALGLIESVLPDSFPSSSPSVSPDGSMLLFSGRRPGTRWELRGLRKGTGESFVLSDRLQSAWTPAFSPDGRYAVLQSGQVDTGPILVTAIEGGGQQEVARAGGFPRWSSDGRYIYYARGPRIFRIEVAYEPAFAIVGTEEFVFAAPSDHVHFDLLKDNTLLTSYPPTRVSPGEIRVVLNFNQEMERMAPR